MATDLILPDGVKPSNLHFAEDVHIDSMESDVFGICDRIKEISPDLYLVVARQQDRHKFIVMEDCVDGVQRKVFAVGEGEEIDELDDRVLNKLRKLQALPLQDRIKAFDRAQAESERRRRDDELEELYEQMGRPMWTDLEKTGFIQRPVSYPKTGVTGGKGSAAKS